MARLFVPDHLPQTAPVSTAWPQTGHLLKWSHSLEYSLPWRFVGDCRRADGVSVAGWMVEHGQALDWPRYSHGAYAAQQAEAEAAKVGLWVGNFQPPWDWRSSHPDGAAPSSRPLGIISRPLVAQSGYSCEPRRYCSQISSCDEAQWYLHNCSWGRKLDRDGDGVACETLC
ncbi:MULTISPECIES: excalibur calcium-binding domain-containing protein [unclassified Mesorhizobium]|uniref:thermonuclease family protein n=1 Tax=unclassified Mesorhizobium TaxID=325217 RepID=UPI001AECCE41|nr:MULTISPECIES: excalibur calcium-binding domain-containing protein [unclassified Mesorhizobium]